MKLFVRISCHDSNHRANVSNIDYAVTIHVGYFGRASMASRHHAYDGCASMP